jgi:type II secretory pathway pseudopilin PulG
MADTEKREHDARLWVPDSIDGEFRRLCIFHLAAMSNFFSQPTTHQSVVKRPRLRRVFAHGFTLLEVMVGMATFTLLSLGITAGVMQSRRLSQLNVLRTSAYTVAQGYMEQMLSINSANIESASESWVSGRPAIPTEAVNALTTNASLVEKSDPLYVSPVSPPYPAGSNLIARTGTSLANDVWNCKQIMIDMSTNTTGGNATPIVMNEYFDVQVSRDWTQVGTGSNATWQAPQSPAEPGYFLIRIDFQFQSPGYPTVGWLSGTLRMARSDIPGP